MTGKYATSCLKKKITTILKPDQPILRMCLTPVHAPRDFHPFPSVTSMLTFGHTQNQTRLFD